MLRILWLIAVSMAIGFFGGCQNVLQQTSGTATPSSTSTPAATSAPTATPSGINFSIWELQEPSGSGTSPTTTYPLTGYSSPYFYVATDGGQAFMDTATGITTSGSSHCRTEMREMTSSGGLASWSATATNTMTVTGKIIQVGGGSSGHVTVGQVFYGTTSNPLGELEWYANRSGYTGFVLLLEDTSAGGSSTLYNLGTQAIGSQYTYTLGLSGGILSVTVNGSTTTYTPDSSFTGGSFYFKCGNYDQTAAAGTVTTTPYTIVETYSVNVSHS
jgi:hypothetical protein